MIPFLFIIADSGIYRNYFTLPNDQGYSQHMMAKILNISQSAIYGVIKRSKKWVVIVTWPLYPVMAPWYHRFL